MATGANPTRRMVPEFLTGRPTQSREDPQREDHLNHSFQDNSHHIQETTGPNATLDPLARLADVLVSMNAKHNPHNHSWHDRPVSTT